MAIEHFQEYLLFYEEEYYSKYIQNLEDIGNQFCSFVEDTELHQWMCKSNLPLHPFEKKRHIIHSSGDGPPVPPYAFALQRYFYKDYLYPEDRYVLQEERKRITLLEQRLADLCHAGRSTIASWKSGVRVPDKYKWWVLALFEFELSYWEIQPFLDMIGCSVDMSCMDDVILFYALCAQKTQQETFLLLNAYHCAETKPLFAPAQEHR